MSHATQAHSLSRTPSPKRRGYRRREPEQTALYQLLAEHLETFLSRLAADPDRAPLPRFVVRELRAFLRCGILAHGFARVVCTGCRRSTLVAFSCKGRGFCPACGSRRMSEASAHLIDHVLPEVPLRQWVLTFPYPIRFLLAYRPELLRAVRRIFVRTLFCFLRRRARDAGFDSARPGAVVVVQRFGSALNLNVHLHALVLDGVFDTPRHGTAPRFHALEILEDRDVERVLARVQRRVLRHLEKLGLLSSHEDRAAEDPAFEEEPLLAACYAGSIVGRQAFGPEAGQSVPRLGDPSARRSPTPTPLCARADGFSLHAAVRIPARERLRRERLARYVLRPPFAAEQLSFTPEGKLLFRLARPFADGTQALRFEPSAFLERLIALVPRPGRPMLTYHGILAPAASWRDHVVPASPTPRTSRCKSFHQPTANENKCSTSSLSSSDPEPPTRRHERLQWAELLRRTYAIDVLVCDDCGARREMIAFLTAPDSIRRILEHLGLPTRPPPIRHSPAALFELN